MKIFLLITILILIIILVYQKREIRELETAATDCTAKITELLHGTGINDKIGNYAAQIADLKALLDLNLKNVFMNSNALIDTFIQSVNDPLIRQIILYRFENNMSWNQIERVIGGNNNSESLRKKLYRYLKNN